MHRGLYSAGNIAGQHGKILAALVREIQPWTKHHWVVTLEHVTCNTFIYGHCFAVLGLVSTAQSTKVCPCAMKCFHTTMHSYTGTRTKPECSNNYKRSELCTRQCVILWIYCSRTSEYEGNSGWYMPERRSHEGLYQSRYCPDTSEYELQYNNINCMLQKRLIQCVHETNGCTLYASPFHKHDCCRRWHMQEQEINPCRVLQTLDGDAPPL